LDEILRAIIQSLLTRHLAFIEIIQIEFIAKIGKRKVGDKGNASQPNDKFDDMKHMLKIQ